MTKILVVVISGALAASQAGAQAIEAGRKQFEGRCAGCHGADANGGERGPGILDLRHGRSQSLREIVRNGIPDAGMPSFQIPDSEMDALLAFLDSLRAPAADHPSPGNADAGRQFFLGKGNCSACHMIGGRGGVLGPDLSNLGNERRMAQIEQALRNPGSATPSGALGVVPPSYQVVSVRLRDGRSLRGLAKNETNWDLQLESLDGTLHLLDKTQLVEEVREPKSLMPPLQATAEEARDLLAYLSRLTSAKLPAPAGGGLPAPSPGAVAFADLVHPKPGEWPTYDGTFSGNRHSPLNQITPANIGQLAPRWIFTIPNARRLEVTPLVVNGVMYVTTANEAYALDAATGRQIWHYGRPLTKGVIGDAAGAKNRGVAVLGDRVFLATDNAHMLALHRLTGQLLWDTEMADYRQHYGATSAPLVVNNLVLSGTSGGDEGARGFVDAYNVSTGERAWRFWLTPAPGEPLSETWVGRALEHGCTTGWLTGTYDPETDLIYWGTGNPCPDYNGDERKGDNLYSSSVVALEADTGKLRWYYQFTPHDLHDWDAAQTPVLIDANFHGRPRKLLVHPNRNGFFYVLDRVTGEFLLGVPFVKKVTWASGIGPDGRPKLVPGTEPTVQGTKACPSQEGATNWMSRAYNPATGLFYVMSEENCNIWTKSSAWWEPGKSFYGGALHEVPGEKSEKFLRALDLQTGKLVWEVPQTGTGLTWGGVLSTAGGVVFYGDDSGALAAVDAKTGKSLWHFQTSQFWKASPMTFMLNGKQYVSVAAGTNILTFGLP
jgi:alcohol dehydrogenase (cytochrome c)